MSPLRFTFGLVITAVGVLLLLGTLNVLDFPWETVSRLWPLALVLWGMAILSGRRGAAGLVSVAFLVFLFSLAAIGYLWSQGKWGPVGEVKVQNLVAAYTDPTNSASLKIQGGAGTFTLDRLTDQLVTARTETNRGEYALDSLRSDQKERVTLSSPSWQGFWWGRYRNKAEVALHAQPLWEIEADMGAAKIDFDLTPFRIGRLHLKTGATSMQVRLGDRADETRFVLETGASSAEIAVPQSSGVEVTNKSGLTSLDLPGLVKSGNVYRTDGFDVAEKKIYITLQAGVSSIEIERY
jgi:hypothetical protein